MASPETHSDELERGKRDNPARARVIRGFEESAAYFEKGAFLIGAVGAFAVVVGAARGLWWLAALSAAFFGGLVWLMVWSRRKSLDPDRSPVLRAILREPHTIATVRHRTASSSSGMFKTHWLGLETTAGDKRGIKVSESEIRTLAEALARLCPLADIRVPGYERPAPRVD